MAKAKKGKSPAKTSVRHRILVLNGPSLNLLGKREPHLYGHETLRDIEAAMKNLATELNASVEMRQSNREGELIDWLHEADERFDGVIINPAAYTHTSLAIADAIRAIGCPVVEVHITNTHAREEARHTSVTAAACIGSIVGMGTFSYALGLRAVIDYLNAPKHQ